MIKTAFFISIASTMFAVLPPLAQSTKEMRAILNDSQLYQMLGSSQNIQEMSRTDFGWVVKTQDLALEIDVIYTPQKQPGPAQFELRFRQPVEVSRWSP